MCEKVPGASSGTRRPLRRREEVELFEYETWTLVNEAPLLQVSLIQGP